MRRKIPALAVMLAFVCALTVSAAPAGAANYCGDSWGADGHAGPWYVNSNQSLHGNTLVISGKTCVGSYWNVTYDVFKEGPGGVVYNPIHSVQNGTGPTSFSLSVNPIGCNQGWLYYTQVRNNVTGNTIRKPQSGLVIC